MIERKEGNERKAQINHALVLLQAREELVKNAKKSTNRENMSERAPEVITSNISNREQQMFESEMEEKPIDQAGV